MGTQYFVDILYDQLGPGAAPVYESDPDEEWYFLDADGKTWKTFPAAKKCYAPEFELAGATKASVVRQVQRAIATICMLQEHGGTAILAVRNILEQRSGTNGAFYSLVGSLIITKKTLREIKTSIGRVPNAIPPHIVIDDFTMQHLDYMDTVEDVHES